MVMRTVCYLELFQCLEVATGCFGKVCIDDVILILHLDQIKEEKRGEI